MKELRWLLPLVFTAFAGGCLPWSSLDLAAAGPMGGTSNGGLRRGLELPQKGDNHLFYRPQRDRRHACPSLGRALLSAAQRVGQRYPGSKLVIGDLSAPDGGKISGHRSHQNGLDADLGFFRRTLAGKPAPPGTDHRFDRFAVALVRHRATLFDEERNLALVEALLTDPHAEIQWIFVSHATKRRLLETALRRAVATDIIERMNTVLRRPGDSTPHDDHFHVRAFCPPHAALCIDNGPTWDWTPLAKARKQPTWVNGAI